MKKYSKVLVTLVVTVLISSIGFATAFGYGSRINRKPVVTAAPQGQVLGESTMSTTSLVNKLVELGIISADKLAFIKLLIALGIIA